MSGIVSPMGLPWHTSLIPIRITSDGKFTIFGIPIQYPMIIEKKLLKCTENVLETFYSLETEINNQVRELKNSGNIDNLVNGLTLNEGLSGKYLKELARTGLIAFNGVFSDVGARTTLINFITSIKGTGLVPNPTFVSQATPFAWEILYEESNYREANPEMFWGFSYAVARSQVDPYTLFDFEHEPKSNMLFCLHESLRQAHKKEWPDIRGLVRFDEEDQIYMLGPACRDEPFAHGEEFLTYLQNAEHNILHFACHCIQDNDGNDVLRLSLLKEDDLNLSPSHKFEAPEIALDTDAFTLTLQQGPFKRSKPLVFLNACQSAGGGDSLRAYYNLPKQFIDRGAAAVIATACPVPDVFAAEFARVFYGYFLRGFDMLAKQPDKATVGRLCIGEALRRTRLYFLKRHNNPLGLAYGLYTPAHYQVRQKPLERSANP